MVDEITLSIVAKIFLIPQKKRTENIKVMIQSYLAILLKYIFNNNNNNNNILPSLPNVSRVFVKNHQKISWCWENSFQNLLVLREYFLFLFQVMERGQNGRNGQSVTLGVHRVSSVVVAHVNHPRKGENPVSGIWRQRSEFAILESIVRVSWSNLSFWHFNIWHRESAIKKRKGKCGLHFFVTYELFELYVLSMPCVRSNDPGSTRAFACSENLHLHTVIRTYTFGSNVTSEDILFLLQLFRTTLPHHNQLESEKFQIVIRSLFCC